MKIELDGLQSFSITEFRNYFHTTNTITCLIGGKPFFRANFIFCGTRAEALRVVHGDIVQIFTIQYIKSNLGIGDVPYFVCPETGKLCRKLYFIGGSFHSRYTIDYTYSKCNNKMWMYLDRVVKAEDCAELKRYGKPYYNNKLTRYGRRVLAAMAKSKAAWRHIPH